MPSNQQEHDPSFQAQEPVSEEGARRSESHSRPFSYTALQQLGPAQVSGGTNRSSTEFEKGNWRLYDMTSELPPSPYAGESTSHQGGSMSPPNTVPPPPPPSPRHETDPSRPTANLSRPSTPQTASHPNTPGSRFGTPTRGRAASPSQLTARALHGGCPWLKRRLQSPADDTEHPGAGSYTQAGPSSGATAQAREASSEPESQGATKKQRTF